MSITFLHNQSVDQKRMFRFLAAAARETTQGGPWVLTMWL